MHVPNRITGLVANITVLLEDRARLTDFDQIIGWLY
jgi:hypothetical protein